VRASAYLVDRRYHIAHTLLAQLNHVTLGREENRSCSRAYLGFGPEIGSGSPVYGAISGTPALIT